MKLRKGDNVIVIAGKDKGQKGKVVAVDPASQRVIVDGVNKVKRHLRSRNKGEKGTTIEREAALHASNVMLFDDKKGKGTRKRAEEKKK